MVTKKNARVNFENETKEVRERADISYVVLKINITCNKENFKGNMRKQVTENVMTSKNLEQNMSTQNYGKYILRTYLR